MSRRKLVSTVALLLLPGIFGRLAYSRAYRVFFAAKPATLAAPYTTEDAWIVDEIVRDIAEMGLGTAGASPTVLTAAQPGIHSVAIPATPPATTTVDLSVDIAEVPAAVQRAYTRARCYTHQCVVQCVDGNQPGARQQAA